MHTLRMAYCMTHRHQHMHHIAGLVLSLIVLSMQTRSVRISMLSEDVSLADLKSSLRRWQVVKFTVAQWTWTR